MPPAPEKKRHMPVAKLHVSAELPPGRVRELAEAVRHAVVRCLDIPPEFGKVIVYTAPLEQRSVHQSRDPGFAFVELHLFSGRPPGVKAGLFKALDQVVREHTGLSPENVFIQLLESPRQDWGLRGGQQADEMELP